MKLRWFLTGLTVGLAVIVLAAQGPAAAQIQAALRGFLATNQTVTGTWTFNTPPGGGVTGGTCTNQAVTAISSSGVPSCTTLTASYLGSAAAGNHLIATALNTWSAVTPALAHAQPADQTARSSMGAFVMMGLGAAAAPCTVTPVATGRIQFIISGDIVNSTTATSVSIKMAENTGMAPANNASATGTVIGRTVVVTNVTSVLTVPFTLISTQTGLALNTAVWFDIQLSTSGVNTGQPTNIDCTAVEL